MSWGAARRDIWLSLAAVLAPQILTLIYLLDPQTWAGKVEPSSINAVLTSPQLMATIGGFSLAMVLVHVALALLVAALWIPFANSHALEGRRRHCLALFFFLAMQAMLIAMNTLLFPASRFAAIASPAMFVIGGLLLLIALLAWHVYRWSPAALARVKGLRWPYYLALPVLAVVGGTFAFDLASPAEANNRRENPDIILIGIDCLRPDHLLANGDPNSLTPNLDAFLAGAWTAGRSYTPLARTFPSWVSILTGRYPLEHGGRYNLISPEKIRDIERSLPFQLRQNGYVTAYAIDESRFSNIDERYGFDKVLVPRIGAPDFLLTKLADTPITNLLTRTPVFGWLFPYQEKNRAAHVIYDPADFDRALGQMVADADRTKPLLLATHFELPHWPFTWRDSRDYVVPENALLATKSPQAYHKAVHRADQQFQALIDALKRNGRLENAVVVVLSDHGEGFGSYAEVLQPANRSHAVPLPPFALHGVNVLDEAQTRTVLAFRTFGRDPIEPVVSSGSVTSLVDVAPTVLALAGLSHLKVGEDGCLLVGDASAVKRCLANRAVFTESGFYVDAMMKQGPVDEGEVAREAQVYYDVSADGRLTIKNDLLDHLLGIKQRAALAGDWMVASIPAGEKRHFVYARLDQRIYWNAELGGRIPHDPSLERAIREFCRFYSPDDSSVKDFCAKRHPRILAMSAAGSQPRLK